ncbi:MAG: sensor histidine kinase [Thermomicrobiales bacterium]|nr:sensor histidine kinase [Thermomicrobiales bacterium]
MIERLQLFPLQYKLIIANVVIVIIGAAGGTWLVAKLASGNDGLRLVLLAMGFALVGGWMSTLANIWVVRKTLKPLDDIAATADRVRHGDYTARTGADPFRDPQLEQIVVSFNGALDQVESDRDRIKDLVNRVIAAQEDERKRIARELHDDTSQVLFAQLLRVSAMKNSENEEIRAVAGQLEDMFAESMEAVRRLGHELRPPSLDDLGLREATGALVQRMRDRSGIDITYDASELRERTDEAIELVLYRVAQEALTNMWKHAHATAANVTLALVDDGIELVVEDNGRGFNPHGENRSDGKGLGLGVFGMQERVDLVGGTLEIEGDRNPGTRVRAWIPLTGDSGA